MTGQFLEDVVHVDASRDGTVWYSWRGRVPVSSGTPVADFSAAQRFPEATRVRLVGSLSNAELINGLYEEQLLGGPAVELGTPRLASTRRHRDTSQVLLVSMCNLSASQMQWRPSVGGWHPLTATEALIYRAASLPIDSEDSAYIDVLQAHPAWQAATFISALCLPSLAAFLMSVRDPRWYIDTQDPDSQKVLRTYLGLRRGECVPEARARAENVKECWKSSARAPEDVVDAPGGFLWRVWLDKAQVPVVADLRASQCFVEFIRQVWLDSIYREQRKGAEPLFVPEHFFARSDEVAAYRAHLEQFKTRVL